MFKEFFQIIIGSATFPQFAASFFFAVITAFAMLLYRTTKRDINSTRTPFRFSYSFLLSDNFLRILYTLILIFLSIRFGQKWFKPEDIAYLGLLIGVISDRLAWLFELLSDAFQQVAKRKVESINKP